MLVLSCGGPRECTPSFAKSPENTITIEMDFTWQIDVNYALVGCRGDLQNISPAEFKLIDAAVRRFVSRLHLGMFRAAEDQMLREALCEIINEIIGRPVVTDIFFTI